MKITRALFVVIFKVIISVSATAQSLPADVVDVIDGKTLVLNIPTGKVTVELQYIDVPAEGQPMYDTVKNHLRKLVSKKRVEYRARSLSFDRTVGQVFLGDVDISQQMLRDGAAWHMPSELSGQERRDFTNYASIEAAAKKEKRGIWAKPDLKPSWEYAAGRRENIASTKPVVASSTRRQLVKPGYWGDKNPKMGEIGALFNGYNAESKKGYLSTGLAEIPVDKFALYDERYQHARLAADISFYYKDSESKGRDGYFLLTLVSEADVPLFSKKPHLTLVTEAGKYPIGGGKRTETRSGGRIREQIVYTLSRSHMEKMSNDVTVLMLGEHFIEPQTIRYWLYNMLQLSK